MHIYTIQLRITLFSYIIIPTSPWQIINSPSTLEQVGVLIEYDAFSASNIVVIKQLSSNINEYIFLFNV